MIRVSQLYAKNIGPFSKATFDFTIQNGHPDIHIFTGANGSGKTTLLHAIASCFDFFEVGHKANVSNLFYKRFHHFSEDEKSMPESYLHCILKNKEDNEAVEKLVVYGCKRCGNIHQYYEKELENNNLISKNGMDYNSEPHYDDLLKYKQSIVSEGLGKTEFSFAVFGYSGYRMINSSKIEIESENNFNPLHLALEFVKDKKAGYYVSNWIVSRYSKAAIERVKGNEQLADKYLEGVQCLQAILGELTNQQVKFEIQTNPWKVILLFNGQEVEFDVLPDGLRSLLSWLGDLLMRLDAIPWKDNTIPVNEQNLILLLDEIEVHLHPKWQYYILPLTKKIFPNAQIFLSTHSAFVLNSVDNAKIYILDTVNGYSKLKDIKLSNTGDSYHYVYERILDTTQRFGIEAMNKMEQYNLLEKEIITGNMVHEPEFREVVKDLKTEGTEVFDIIVSKLNRVKRLTGINYLNGTDQ